MLTRLRLIAAMFAFCATVWGEGSSAAAPVNLFGPKEYARTTGTPNEFSERFDNCEPQSQYQLVVENGNPDGTQRLSSASVLLNGTEVLRPNELNQQIGRLERPIPVSPINMLSVRLASGPDGVLNAWIECVANCLAVHVTSPAPSAEITVPSVSVFGTLASGSDQVGVVVNGLPTFVSGSRFVANRIPLGLGSNTIVAAVTNACGLRGEDMLVIQTPIIRDHPVALTAFPTQGLAPFTPTLNSTTHLDQPIAKYRWDFDGGGITDAEGDTLSTVTPTYDEPGLYLPRLMVEDSQGNRFSDQIGVVVVTREEIDRLLTKQWSDMKSRLAKRDVEGAMKLFAEGSSKEMFRKNFDLMKDILPQIVSDMAPITFDRLEGNGDVAFYKMQAEQGGKMLSFPVNFEKDSDGIWRIRFF
jgi:hypothetical protein